LNYFQIGIDDKNRKNNREENLIEKRAKRQRRGRKDYIRADDNFENIEFTG